MPTTSLKYLCALVAACSASFSYANNDPLWLKNTALSPDGSKIAFTYQSKIYIAPSQGGDARALTGGEFYPHALSWSSDNSTLAFAANPFGNDDVFTLSLDSLAMKRLTYNSGSDIPTGFTPDGQQVLFSTTRSTPTDQDFYSQASPWSFGSPGNQLYTVNLANSAMQSILAIPARHATWNLKQDKLLYNTPHKDQRYRKHQSSFAVPTIWLFDAKTKQHRQLTPDRIAAQSPVWDHNRDGFYYLSEQSGDFNVWYYNLATKETSQLTQFAQHPVRDLTVADNGDIAFSYRGELYRLGKGSHKPQKIALNIAHFAPSQDRYFSASYASAFMPANPGADTDSDEMLLASYGDIFALDTEKDKVQRLTNSAAAEKQMVYTPDGYGVLYAALRNGNWGLYITQSLMDEESLSTAPVVDETPFLQVDGVDITQPKYSPDGKKLAFVVGGRSLHVIDLDNYAPSKTLPEKLISTLKGAQKLALGSELISPENVSERGSLQFTWSPDSSQLAVHVNPSPYNNDILVVDAEGKKPAVNVSQNGFYNTLPKWSDDSRILSWLSTEGGLKSTDGEDANYVIKGVFTNGQAKADYQNEVALEEDEIPSYAFSARNLEYRQAFEFPFSGNILDFALFGDQLYVVDAKQAPDGDELTRSFVYDIRKQQTELLFNDLPLAMASVIRPQQGVMYLQLDTDVVKVDLETADKTYIPINLPIDYRHEPRKVAAYQQMLKQTEQLYYRQDMGKVDWQYYSQFYLQFLPHINNDRDLGVLISELYGELNASHTGGYGDPREKNTEDDTAALGLVFTSQRATSSAKAPSEGLVIDSILPGGPADLSDVVLNAGDKLVAVNGKPVTTLPELAKVLNHKAEQQVELTLTKSNSLINNKERHVRVTPTDSAGLSALAAKRWEIERRNYVTKQTKGKVAYVYLPDMSNESFQHLRSEALGRFRSADALILDVRFNGGGFLADTLIEFLTARKVADVVPHAGRAASDASRRNWLKPSFVIANSASYSEASAFSQYFQDLKVGPIIGEPVPGTGTAVTGFESEVYDGIRYRFPYLPLKNMTGQYYENLELQPDVLVFNTPEQVSKGQDAQLDAAISEAMKQFTP
ncbi:S41 family peptidase [Photobacterium sanguinicancri]|uniref:S41 family peptidase n=1 Tax=Photobacterium sanguinicancri TaxID=875932 RepID=UPI002480F920|nr:S41 family peptidase [Photobacterium sanguinicancri]